MQYALLVIRSAFEALSLHLVRKRSSYLALSALIALALLAAAFILLLPPSGFPRGARLELREGEGLSQVGARLEDAGVIRSALAFKAVGRFFRADTRLQAGSYVFAEPVGLSTVLYRLETGISGIPTVRVTFPEGFTAREIAATLAASIPGFDGEAFRALAEPQEGRLFPDTYAISIEATPDEVLALLLRTYEAKVAPLRPAMAAAGLTETEALTLASILEKEAKGDEDRRIVAGILRDRLTLGMPLQVDAVFGYIKGIDTYHPSGEDLELDSPYNTYRYLGLPPGPIGNPGIAAIEAALAPADTPYLYYLSGKDGMMHYAATFEEHKKNKELHL